MFIKKYLLKNVSVVLSCVVIFMCLISMSKFNVSCDKIKDDVLRLHIRANSDSEFDQELKLKVRDRILNDTGDLFYSVMTYEEAVEKTNEALPKIIESAKDEIKNQGYDYDVKANLDYSYFGTRHYDGYTLPAGNYMALNLEIGEGKGQNWWCVMFPSLCFIDISSGVVDNEAKQNLQENLEEESYSIISDTNNSNVKFKFKLIEFFAEKGLFTANKNL